MKYPSLRGTKQSTLMCKKNNHRTGQWIASSYLLAMTVAHHCWVSIITGMEQSGETGFYKKQTIRVIRVRGRSFISY